MVHYTGANETWLQTKLWVATMEKARTAAATGLSLLTVPTAIKRDFTRWPADMSVVGVADCTGYYCQGRTSDYLAFWE